VFIIFQLFCANSSVCFWLYAAGWRPAKFFLEKKIFRQGFSGPPSGKGKQAARFSAVLKMVLKMETTARAFFLSNLRKSLDPAEAAERLLSFLTNQFLDSVDIEEVARGLNFANSCTTLHDRELGAEIMEQADLWARWDRWVKVGKIRERLGGEDSQISGQILSDHMDEVAKRAESMLRRRDWRAAAVMVRTLSHRLKKSAWWLDREDETMKTLARNRKKMREVRGVMDC
jgi:hypothetical protein